jgi:hypothetical protein
LRREPVTELDVERNAALEAELMRKLEVQKEALSKQEKEIWQKEMQVDDVCKIRTRIQICFMQCCGSELIFFGFGFGIRIHKLFFSDSDSDSDTDSDS